MTDAVLLKISNIPPATLSRWKIAKDWRKGLYSALKNMNDEVLKDAFLTIDTGHLAKAALEKASSYEGKEKELYMQGVENGIAIILFWRNSKTEIVKKATEYSQYATDAINRKSFLGNKKNEFFINGSKAAAEIIISIIS